MKVSIVVILIGALLRALLRDAWAFNQPCSILTSSPWQLNTINGDSNIFTGCDAGTSMINLIRGTNAPTTIVFRRLKWERGKLAITANMPVSIANLTIVLENSVVLEMDDFLVFESIYPIENVTIRIVNSTISSSRGSALVFRGLNGIHRGIRIEAFNSIISAGSPMWLADDACFSIVSSTTQKPDISNVFFGIYNSSVSYAAQDMVAVASIFITNGVNSVTASIKDVVFRVHQSTVDGTASSRFAVALSIGSRVSGASASSAIVVERMTMHVSEAAISVVASELNAAGGVLQFSDQGDATLNVSDYVASFRNSSVIRASGQSDTIAAGSIVARSGSAGSARMTLIDVELSAEANTTVTAASGRSQSLSLSIAGLSLAGTRMGIVTCNNCSLTVVANSTVEALTQSMMATAVGIFARGLTAGRIVGHDIKMLISASRVKATAANNGQQAQAIGLLATSNTEARVTSRTLTMIVIGSRVDVQAPTPPVQALSFGAYSASAIAVAEVEVFDATIFICGSTIVSSRTIVDAREGFDFETNQFANTGNPTVGALQMTILNSSFMTTMNLPESSCATMIGRGGAMTAARPSTFRNSTFVCLRGVGQRNTPVPNRSVFASRVVTDSGTDISRMLVSNANTDPSDGPFAHFTGCRSVDSAEDAAIVTKTPTMAPVHTTAPTKWARRSTSLTALQHRRTDSTTTAVAADLSRSASTSWTAPATRLPTLSASAHRSRSRSVSSTELPTTMTPMPPTSNPTLPPKPSVRLDVVMPSDAAEVVTATAASTTVVSGVLVGPSGVAQVARVAAVSKLLSCALDSSSDAADDPPSFVELPLQADIGTGSRGRTLGATLLSSVFLIALPFTVHAALWRKFASRLRTALRVFAAVHAIALQYFSPTVVGAATAVISSRSDAVSGLERALAAACLILGGLLPMLITLRRLHVVKPQITDVGASESTSSSTSSSSKTAAAQLPSSNALSQLDPSARDALLPLIDGCRTLDVAAVRQLSSVEVGTSCFAAVVSSLQLAPSACTAKAAVIAVIFVSYLCYIACFRPHNSRVDTVFAAAGGCLQLALAAVSVAVATAERDGRKPSETASAAAGYILLLIFISFFLQTVIQAAWYLCKRARANALAREEVDVAMSAIVSPLLNTPDRDTEPSDEVSSYSGAAANPLSSPSCQYQSQ